MSPDELANRVEVLNRQLDLSQRETEELRKQLSRHSKVAPKSAGKLDGKGAKVALGGGIVCAPVGMWASDIVDLFYAKVDAGVVPLPEVWRLSMVEDLVGALVGAVIGTVIVGVYKFLKAYG